MKKYVDNVINRRLGRVGKFYGKGSKSFLIVYNICGIKNKESSWYIECLKSILSQDFEDFHLAVSSYGNTDEQINNIHKEFGDRVSVWRYKHEPELSLSVNITFNATVRQCIKKFGEFNYYHFLDSGCKYTSNSILSDVYTVLEKNDYAMLALKTDNDFVNRFQAPVFDTQKPGEDFICPIGHAPNGHANFWTNEFRKTYNDCWSDVFMAYCSETTFSHQTAALHKKYVVLKDHIITHKKGIDGASITLDHRVNNKPWNNLYFNRDANNFINDKKAIKAGMGYEEIHNIMNHSPDAYDDNGNALYPDELIEVINKYWYLSKEEFDYDKIIEARGF